MFHTQLIVKSKSSNTAIVGKSEGKKKCWSSSQEVQEVKGGKKRGVYVSKKAISTEMSPRVSPDRRIRQNCKDPADTLRLLTRASAISNKMPKRGLVGSPLPLKRPPKNSFLDSVLNILSQESTATQFPEIGKNKFKKYKFGRKRENITGIEQATQDLDALFKDTPLTPVRAESPVSNAGERNKSPSPQRERKPRFKSKILNQRLDEKMLILQAKKEIMNTPSNYSSSAVSKCESHKSRDLNNKKTSFTDEIITAQASNAIDEKTSPKDKKECSKDASDKEKYDAKDSKKHRKKAVVRIDEPVTLVSEQTDKNEPDKDENLYNLVVDLLKNTISSYKLHEDEEPLDISKMEIEDNVANKLNFQDQVNVKTSSANIEHTNVPTVAAAENVSSVSKTKCYAITDDGVTDRIEEIKPQLKSIIHKPAAPYVKPIEYLPYNSVLRSASFEYNNIRPLNSIHILRSVSPMNNMRSAYFEYNNKMRSNSFGYNDMRSSFGYNNNMRSNSFGYNDMRPSFGYNNNMRSNSFGYNNMRSASFRNKSKKFAPFGYQNMKFASSGRPKPFYPRTSYENPNKKPSPKKNKKPNLLRILKKELQMDDNWYEEPETIHQALKVIANNQKRTRKSIHFDERTFVRRHDDDDDGGSECIFKRRRIISERGKKKQRKRQNNRYPFDSIYENPAPKSIVVANYPPTNKSFYGDDDNAYYPASYHSIEVNGYDYETNDRLRLMDTLNKPIFYALPSEESIVVDSVAVQSKKSILAESLHSATSLTCKIDGNCETRLSNTSVWSNVWPNQQSIHSMASSKSSASTTVSQMLRSLNEVTV